MIAFETEVGIDRPVEEVFAYVSDPLNLPRWNSAVEAVGKTSAGEDGGASTYMMERKLPTGRAVNERPTRARLELPTTGGSSTSAREASTRSTPTAQAETRSRLLPVHGAADLLACATGGHYSLSRC